MLREQEEGGRRWPRPRSGRLTATFSGSGAVAQKERAEEPPFSEGRTGGCRADVGPEEKSFYPGSCQLPGSLAPVGTQVEQAKPLTCLSPELPDPALMAQFALQTCLLPGRLSWPLHPLPHPEARCSPDGPAVTISGSSSACSHVGALPARPARPCTASGSGRHECLQVGVEEAGPGEASIPAPSVCSCFPSPSGFCCVGLCGRNPLSSQPHAVCSVPSGWLGPAGSSWQADRRTCGSHPRAGDREPPPGTMPVPGLRSIRSPAQQVVSVETAGVSWMGSSRSLVSTAPGGGRARCRWAFTEGRLS